MKLLVSLNFLLKIITSGSCVVAMLLRKKTPQNVCPLYCKLVELLPEDHDIDEERGGTPAAPPSAAPHIDSGGEEGAHPLKQQLPVIQQEVGLFELASLVLNV
jgi:hypothetical protein